MKEKVFLILQLMSGDKALGPDGFFIVATLLGFCNA